MLKSLDLAPKVKPKIKQTKKQTFTKFWEKNIKLMHMEYGLSSRTKKCTRIWNHSAVAHTLQTSAGIAP